MTIRIVLVFVLVLASLGGCRKTAPEPEFEKEEPAPDAQEAPVQEASSATTAESAQASEPAPAPVPTTETPVPPGHRKVQRKPVAPVTPSPDDPLAGKFDLTEAEKGLTGKGGLIAEIKTSLGNLECDLYEDRAPITVANFVGLARGLRPWKNPKGAWVKTPAYDKTTFHRIVRGFMIQGGDAEGTGRGNPGYVIPDEIWEDAYHSERGLLCMANRGPNTNAAQFFIMDGDAPHLDGGYTIFGKCGPDSVIETIAKSEVKGDLAVSPPVIKKVAIRRGKLRAR